MALGIPTVATAIGANFRIIEHEVNGLLVKPNDVEGWEIAISRLIENPQLRKKIGMMARKTLEERYSVKSWEKIYLNIISKVTSSKI
jgi:glycosyltransferase involved in cell wall biosynthesis